MLFGYFGPTSYDSLKIKIKEPTKKIEISISSDSPEYLNLGKIEFINNKNKIQHIDIFNNTYQGSAWLSSRRGLNERNECTFEIKKGMDIHSGKEKNPTIQILLKEDLSDFIISIKNRSDYWGVRSSKLKVEAFGSGLDGNLIKHTSFKIEEHISKTYKKITKNLVGKSGSIPSVEEVRSSICHALDNRALDMVNIAWPEMMMLTDITSNKATHEDVKIWAAFLIAQHVKSRDCSVLNILNPEDTNRLEEILAQIDIYSQAYSIPINAEKIISKKASKLLNEDKWKLAKMLYSELLKKRKDCIDYKFGLAECFDALKDIEQAKPIYLEAIKSQKNFKQEHLNMFLANPSWIKSRVFIFEFINAHLNEIEARAYHSIAQPRSASLNKIFCYWAQGIDTPPIVSACQRQHLKMLPKDSVVLLNEQNIKNFVTIPESIKTKLNTRSAFFSDILRLLLLSQYGGTWIDATCYLTGKLSVRHKLADGPFTAFRITDPSTLSVWYLKARNDSWIIHAWKEAMLLYWEKHNKETNYFIFHHVFEALYNLNERFKNERNSVEQKPSLLPHKWYFKLSKDFDPLIFMDICEASNIHKLTYKTNSKMERSDSFYAHAIRGF